MSQTPIDFINLFVQPPGDLIYFLVVVAVSQAAFFMALGHRMRRPYERSTRRYVTATLGVVLTWVFLMAGALFALLTSQDSASILPPLERAANVITILLIGWVFLTADHNGFGRGANLVLLGLMALVIGAYMFTGVEWPALVRTTDFNTSPYGMIWTVVPLVVSAIGLLLVLANVRFVADAPLKLLFFVVLVFGYGATLAQMTGGTITGDYAGPARLAFLAALPIVPAIIYRMVVGQLETELVAVSAQIMPARTAEIPRSSLPQTGQLKPPPMPVTGLASERESVQLMRALGLILEGATPTNIPEKIINAALQVLQADVGALLTVQNAQYVDIRAGLDRSMQRPIAGMSINLSTQPTLANAIERRSQRPLFMDRNYEELRDLYSRLDIEQIGPTYFQPLVHEKELLAILVIGLPYSSRELEDWGQELLKGIAIIAANLLALSNAAESARVRSEERIIQALVKGVPPEDLDDNKVMAAWQEMQGSLEASRDQINELSRQVMTLKIELDYERGRVADVLSDTDEGQSVSQRIVALSEEQQKLLEDRERLASRLRDAETALAGATMTGNESVFQTMIDVLNREKDELFAQRASLEQQLADMRASGSAPMPQVVQDMLERMAQEKARLEVERNQLNGKVEDIEAQLRVLGIEGGAAGVSQVIGQLYEHRAALQARNDLLQRERDALLNERMKFEDRMRQEEAREKQLQTLQNELKNVAGDREAITRQRDQLRRERDEFAARVDALKEQRARLTADVSAFEQELAEAHDEQAQLQAQIQQLANQRSELAVHHDRLLAERQALETERDQLLARVEGNRERLQQLGADGVGSLTKIIEDISAQRDTLEHELNETRTTLAAVQNQLEALQVRAYFEPQSVPKLDNPALIVGLVQELRTPMTSVIGYVDLLLNESAGILGEMQRKFLQRVTANITRLASMLDDLVRITMLDTGQFVLARQPVDVVSVIEDAITNAASQLREKGLTVHLNLADDVPTVRADPDAINQIIGQLLTNAYLVSPSGSEIFITARQQRVRFAPNGANEREIDSLYVSIEDRGGGIVPEDQMRVFSRKYKAENPLIQGLGDTGVGLAIAKALVEAHDGRIWLETQDNVGSAFNFALPLEAVPEVQES